MKPSRKLLSSVIFFSMTSHLVQAASDITISNQLNSDITGTSPFRDVTNNGGTSNLQVVTLVGALGTSNVVVTTNTAAGGAPFNGRLEVKDTITWGAANSLSLNADANIVIGATINSIGGGSLNLTSVGAVSFDADVTLIGAPAGLSVNSLGVTQTESRKLLVDGFANIRMYS
ncbi:MAG: hypothetical protein MUF13_03035 [Akkermansiaceae bacterium]|nr:hypothetical protein [Akkermansiaceae bacterium]